MKKRSIALLLCAAILMSLFPVMSTLAYDSSPITVTASSTTLPENADKDNGSVTLTAAPASDSVSPTNYHWQIQIPSANLWVDITGASGAKLDVTYAMVASALSGKTASLRAAATVNGETAYSEAVKLTVGAAVEPAAVKAAASTPKVLSQAKATTTPTTAPTTAPTEAPAADTAALEKAVTDAEASLKAAQEALTSAQAKVEPAKAAQTAAAQAVTDAETALAAAKAALETPAEGANTEDLQAAVTAAESKLAEVTDQKAIADATAVKAESDAKLAADAVTAAETALKDAKAALEAAKTPAAAPVRRAPAISLFANESNTNTTYSVVINYVFGDGKIAADPNTATLAAGSNFSATVKHPTVQGYVATQGEGAGWESGLTFASDEVTVNIANISADITVNVVYQPTNVNYTVIHYQQGVDNDNYTQVAQETKTGKTNSTVPEVANKYDGFYALLYEKPPAIAADGSTVVEVYYDRYYYLMNFDLDGGYGVEPIYARYGAKIENVGTPTKAGYSFAGWSPEVPATVPVGGGIYTAQWTANDTAKVKVVIWGENPNDEEYSYLTTGELMLKPGTEYAYNGTDQLYLYCDKEAHTHDASCIICGKVEHTQHTEECLGECTHTEHTLDCYSAGNNKLVEATKPSQITNYPTDGIYTYTTSVPVVGDVTHYYLYLGGKWYCADGEWYEGGSDIAKITLNCTHTHTDECYTCETHTHTAACYRCGKEEHSHDNNCTGSVEGLDSTRWKFVKSDTVTVNPDGSSVINVYYDRVEYMVRFYTRNGNSEYTNYRITAKWGEYIQDKWPVVNGNSAWYVSTNSSTFQAGIQVMPVGGAKFYGPMDGSAGEAYYYVEALQGVTPDKTYQNVGYVLHHKDNVPRGTTVTKEDKYAIEGFTYYAGTSNEDDLPGAEFYYTRHRYVIEFYSPTQLLKKTENVPYESALSSYNWTPDASQAPAQYEPGSVRFEGWYLNPECTGGKFDFTTHTMPAGTNNGDTTLTLYAKWVPVTHTVNFYLDKAAYEAGTTLDGYPKVTVPHGSKVEPTPAEPENGSYEFISWFYMDNGVEKAFDFANMPVNKDLKVYGKWSSNVLKQYYVYYKIQGTDTEVAAPTTGSGLAGITKTFDAKGGTDLYTDYQEGYFPVVMSHSLTIDIDDEAKNTFTFWYVKKDAVPYTVKYLNKETGVAVAPEKTVSDNRKAVVTETFVPVSGMMPDAYQKRLVVSAEEGAVNEIIFYYTEDTTHAYYKITHFTQNTDGKNWTEYASSQASGDIGKTCSADSMTIPGFTFDETVEGTVISGELTANGLELKLYYVRNRYPYEVRYLEQVSGKQLAKPKTDTDLYGKVISESPIDIANYTPVDPTSQTLTIKIEEGETAELNVITFYYKENEATINYEVVGPDGCGTVTPTSETLKVLSGTAQGSTAAAKDNFRFLGWYTDKNCTKPVDTSWVKDNKLTPVKDENDVWTKVTYYAKFEYNTTSLTITKKLGGTSTKDESFIFTVTAPKDSVNMQVVIKVPAGSDQASITIDGLTVGGSVTVTEDTSFNRDFTTSNNNATIKSLNATKADNKVEITNGRSNRPWLTESTHEANHFSANSAN